MIFLSHPIANGPIQDISVPKSKAKQPSSGFPNSYILVVCVVQAVLVTLSNNDKVSAARKDREAGVVLVVSSGKRYDRGLSG